MEKTLAANSKVIFKIFNTSQCGFPLSMFYIGASKSKDFGKLAEYLENPPTPHPLSLGLNRNISFIF